MATLIVGSNSSGQWITLYQTKLTELVSNARLLKEHYAAKGYSPGGLEVYAENGDFFIPLPDDAEFVVGCTYHLAIPMENQVI